MTRHVTLISDQPAFASAWRNALASHGLETKLHGPDELGLAVGGSVAVVFDASCRAFDEDELLAAVGFVRAVGLIPAVQVASTGPLALLDDVVHELCVGLVAKHVNEIHALSAAIARRLDRARARRFEFVTVTPREGEILAVLGDGRAVLVRRPIGARDDGTDVVTIEVDANAATATLSLASGRTLTLASSDVVPNELPAVHDVNQRPIDGALLGQRLRALRLEAGLTQAELARRTGIHRPNIARVEAGRHTPSLETLARLASAIGVATARVLSGD